MICRTIGVRALPPLRRPRCRARPCGLGETRAAGFLVGQRISSAAHLRGLPRVCRWLSPWAAARVPTPIPWDGGRAPMPISVAGGLASASESRLRLANCLEGGGVISAGFSENETRGSEPSRKPKAVARAYRKTRAQIASRSESRSQLRGLIGKK